MAKRKAPRKASKAQPAALRLEWRTAEELADNPANWREHPQSQIVALSELINDVGWAGALLFNEATGRLIDGHARKKLTKPGDKMPVLVGRWTAAQERKILARLDPIGAMAVANRDSLRALLDEIGREAPRVHDMPVDFGEPPESVQSTLATMQGLRRKGNADVAAKNDTERYLVIVFADREKKEAALEALGLPADERYVPAESVELKPTARPQRATAARKIKAAQRSKAGACG